MTRRFLRNGLRDSIAVSILISCVSIVVNGARSFAQTDAIPAAVQGKSPLEGQVQDKAPLEGMVQDKAPLEGTIEGKAPLEGKVDQKTIEGHVEDRAPLDASLQNSGFDGKAQTPQAARKPLEGRLEEIGKPSSKLPIELTSKVHKNQPLIFIMEQAQMAPVKPRLLTGGVAQLQANAKFPDFFVRTWGGHLTILERDVYKPDPADSHLVLKEYGVVVVKFVKKDDAVDVVPTAVFFKRRPVDRFHHMRRREAALDPNEYLKPEIYYDYPLIALGDEHWKTDMGTSWEDQVLHNSLQMIGENSAEEDVVFARSRDGKPYGYRETVVRFTWRTQNSIFMQAGVVDYDQDRNVRKSTKVEGTITPGWEPFAKEISGITGRSWPETTKLYHL